MVQSVLTLRAGGSLLVVSLAGDCPAIRYFGADIPGGPEAGIQHESIRRLLVPGAPEREAPLALTPLIADGWPGEPGLSCHRAGRDWAPMPRLVSVEQAGAHDATLLSRDSHSGIVLIHRLALDPDSGVLRASTEIRNEGEEWLEVQFLASPCLPLPAFLDHVMGFEGRWALEFMMRKSPLPIGRWQRENRRGRTSHDSFPGLLLEAASTSWTGGEALGLHLGWSGNHRIIVERLADGRGYALLGELLLPGEMRLGPGESYRSPDLHAAPGTQGRNAVMARFHRHVRRHVLRPALAAKPRPVHFNSWEAVYFALDEDSLMTLVEEAAAVGAERFVLDDGWFKGRRHDRAGLGDWIVDETVFPDGLAPLIAKVHALGMEFGLWVEPEMVNPDSDLYRAHPDWVLAAPAVPQIAFRHQLVLDLGRQEVSDHLFARLDALLRENDIAYLKWDMNRDVFHPGDAEGRPSMHRQTLALYALIDRLRAAHPDVEIESCASGGGRADYGILARTDRIWTSDSNDALDRLAIERGFQVFFPPEVMGSHVGPRECHITGRMLPMALRAGVALSGHMGIEADLRRESERDKAILARAIALHKRLRPLLHGGRRLVLDGPSTMSAFLVMDEGGKEALLSIALLASEVAARPAPLRLAGLDPDAVYELREIWPSEEAAIIVHGALLMQEGLAISRTLPASQRLFLLRRV